MKILKFLLLSLLIAIAFKPSSTAGYSKWKEIETRVEDLKHTVWHAATYMKIALWLGDPDVAVELSEEVDAKLPEALRILSEVEALISSKSLTSQKTRELYKKLQKIVVDLKAKLEPFDFSVTQTSLHEHGTLFASSIRNTVEEIIQILDGVYNFKPIDWTNIGKSLEEIKKTLASTTEQIKSIAWIGSADMSEDFDDLVTISNNLMEHAYVLSVNKSLTSSKVQEIQNHVTMQLSVKNNFNPENLKKLSRAGRKEIDDSIKDASEIVRTNFKYITNVLEGTCKPPVSTKWDKVIHHVMLMYHEIMALIPKVGAVTVKDPNRKKVHDKLFTSFQLTCVKSISHVNITKDKAMKDELIVKEVIETVANVQKELSKLKREKRDLISMLAPSAAKTIKSLIMETSNKIDDIGMDIIELLEENKDTSWSEE